jgi:soluble lytic murein transglycosylase-like protein
MIRKLAAGLSVLAGMLAVADTAPAMEAGALDAMIARHAAAHGLPADLVRRVIMRESRGNASAVNAGNYGIMQIRHGTARAMGYSGAAEGLLDAETNMTYAVKYLAGAYRAAGGNSEGAISNYQRGYYHAAKRQGFSPYAATASLQPGPVFSLQRAPRPRLSRRAIRQQARAMIRGDFAQRARGNNTRRFHERRKPC